MGLPRAPSLPRRRGCRSSARSPALSAARWVRRELAEQRRGGGVSRRRGDGAGTPEPAVSALGRGGRQPFAALGLRGARRWRRLWALEAEAEPGRLGREGRGEERGEACGEGLRARGEGLGRRGGGCSKAGAARAGRRAPTARRAQPAAWSSPGLLRWAQKLRVAFEAGGSEANAPLPWLSVLERICAFLSPPLCAPFTLIPQISLMKSS